MKRFVMVTTYFLGMISSVFANEIVTTDQGVKVILKDDGTWEKMESSVDNSDILLAEDLVLDAILLDGQTVTLILDIKSCGTLIGCFVKDWMGQILVETASLPRSTRKVLLRQCEDKY